MSTIQPPTLPERTPARGTAIPAPRPASKLRGVGAAFDAPLGWVEQVGGMTVLAGRALAAAVTPPFTWFPEFIEQSWLILKRCLLPMAIAVFVFSYEAPGQQGANVLATFGSLDRLGAFAVMATVRELAGWVNGMVIVGVAGTAICADLGARKVRDELDAMAVIGIDPIKQLVTPRLLALTIMTPLFVMLAIVISLVGTWFGEEMAWGSNTGGFIATFTSNFSLPDLYAAVLRSAGVGLVIAVPACYKGMNVSGGARGVGKAVNQAVVLGVVGLWCFSELFTQTLLAAFPETGNLH